MVRARNEDGWKLTTSSSTLRTSAHGGEQEAEEDNQRRGCINVKEDLTGQGMNMREAVDNSRNRMIWRSLVEASSSAYASWRRNWMAMI